MRRAPPNANPPRILARCLWGLVLATCALGPTAAAAVTWYQVEVIVFSELKPDLGSESWSSNPGSPDLKGSVELSSGLSLDGEVAGNARAYSRVGPKQYTLHAEWARLNRSSRYRPILHVSWRQPGLERDQARPVHLASGRDSLGSQGASVRGAVQVWRSRYLHIKTDLLYRLARSGNRSASFRMRQHRRMRSRELHYLDHPMFGVLVHVVPIERGANAAVPPAPSRPGAALMVAGLTPGARRLD